MYNAKIVVLLYIVNTMLYKTINKKGRSSNMQFPMLSGILSDNWLLGPKLYSAKCEFLLIMFTVFIPFQVACAQTILGKFTGYLQAHSYNAHGLPIFKHSVNIEDVDLKTLVISSINKFTKIACFTSDSE